MDPIFGFGREQWLDYVAYEERHGWLSASAAEKARRDIKEYFG